MIRSATSKDSGQIAEIYNHYISTSIITFEEDPITSDEMSIRISATFQEKLPWLIFEHNGQILGYAYASKWKGRCAYRYSVESTVYLCHKNVSKGLGSKLYSELIKELKFKKFHTAIGGIALPNESSIGLHEKLGFEKVAHFKEVGNKFNQWIDVGYWQLKLND